MIEPNLCHAEKTFDFPCHLKKRVNPVRIRRKFCRKTLCIIIPKLSKVVFILLLLRFIQFPEKRSVLALYEKKVSSCVRYKILVDYFDAFYISIWLITLYMSLTLCVRMIMFLFSFWSHVVVRTFLFI